MTLASVATPMLRRAGYDRERAGAILSAGGIGAVLSPPVMGAASFLIAELTRVPYLEVIRWSLVPTLLYYVSILLMIELDAARLPAADAMVEAEPLGRRCRGKVRCTSLNLAVLVRLLVLGVLRRARRRLEHGRSRSPASWLRRADTAVTPSRLLRALDDAGRRLVPVAITCAVAGILVGVVSLTGLGLKFSGILIGLSGGQLLPALLATAAVLLVLGLALPVTASYVVAAVITAPALVKLGVPEPAAHLFIFYFALLSEVTPPTALSCLAVSAITGGDPVPHDVEHVALRAARVRGAVPVRAAGRHGLLLVGPWPQVVLATTASAVAGIAALVAGAVGGWWSAPLGWPQRVAAGGGGAARSCRPFPRWTRSARCSPERCASAWGAEDDAVCCRPRRATPRGGDHREAVGAHVGDQLVRAGCRGRRARARPRAAASSRAASPRPRAPARRA